MNLPEITWNYDLSSCHMQLMHFSQLFQLVLREPYGILMEHYCTKTCLFVRFIVHLFMEKFHWYYPVSISRNGHCNFNLRQHKTIMFGFFKRISVQCVWSAMKYILRNTSVAQLPRDTQRILKFTDRPMYNLVIPADVIL